MTSNSHVSLGGKETSRVKLEINTWMAPTTFFLWREQVCCAARLQTLWHCVPRLVLLIVCSHTHTCTDTRQTHKSSGLTGGNSCFGRYRRLFFSCGATWGSHKKLYPSPLDACVMRVCVHSNTHHFAHMWSPRQHPYIPSLSPAPIQKGKSEIQPAAVFLFSSPHLLLSRVAWLPPATPPPRPRGGRWNLKWRFNEISRIAQWLHHLGLTSYGFACPFPV